MEREESGKRVKIDATILVKKHSLFVEGYTKRREGKVKYMDEFIGLYSQVYQDLYRIAYYYMGNKEEAEDITSETVLRAYENFPSLRDKGAFRKWIIRILINGCKSQQKKRAMQNRIPLENLKEEEKLSVNPDYTTSLAIRMALEELTEEERLIVVLHIVCGYKGKEISRILKKNHSTIRSKYRRALGKLQMRLEG